MTSAPTFLASHRRPLNILVTGADGQVGWELQRTLSALGRVHAMDRGRLDLTDPDALRAALRELAPQVVVNAAAYTAVDQAEEDEAAARVVNAEAPGLLAEEMKRLGGMLIHFSTDYVFDGTKREPYTETDIPHPRSVYGRTKLAGEEAVRAVGGAHLILRTSWVYGTRGKNFLLTVRRLAREREELRIVDDQWGAPTWCRDLAEVVAQLLAVATVPGTGLDPVPLSGVYHLSAGGQTTWHRFAGAILEHLRAMPGAESLRAERLIPITTAQFPTPARRPAYSVLSNRRVRETFGLCLPDWQAQLRLAMESLRG
jgi:dTDP-4-dehydrorhamnose reductase